MNRKSPQTIEIGKTLKYLWQFIRPVKWLFFGANFFSGLAVLLGFFVVPVFLKEFLDLIFEFSGDDKADLLPDLFGIVWKILVINFFAFWIFARIAEFLLCKYVARAMQHAEAFSFDQIIKHSPDFFANNFVGSLTSKFGRFVRSIDGINTLVYFNFFPNVLRFLAAIGIIFYFAPKIAIILAIWVCVFLGTIFWLVQKYRLPTSLKVAQHESKTSGKNADAFSNILPIKMFARQEFEKSFFGDTIQKLFKVRLAAWYMWAKINIVQSLMVTFLEVFSLYLMAQMWADGSITVGTIVLIQGFLLQIYINLWTFGGNIQDFFQNLADADEMIEILLRNCTRISFKEMDRLLKLENPRDAKMITAYEITKIFHGVGEANSAQNRFIQKFKRKEMPEDAPLVRIGKDTETLFKIVKICVDSNLSGNKIRNYIKHSAVKINGIAITDLNTEIFITENSLELKVGKKDWFQIVK